MKHLKEFESWANGIYEAAIEKPTEKQISRERDIVYQASRDYPDLNKEQALGLYLDDKLKDFDRRDMDQNAVINAQRKENAKLTANLNQLQQTLRSVEDAGKESDAEIQRLKSLSGKLSTDVQQRQVSSADVARALAQVEELKNKPGMSDEQYKKLKNELEDAKQNISKINPEEFETLSNQIKTLSGENSLEKEQLARLADVTAKLTAKQQEVQTQKSDVMSKIAQLEKNQRELEQREQNLSKEIDTKVTQKVAAETEKLQKYRKAVQARSKQASTLIKNFLNNDLPYIYDFIDDKFPDFKLSTEMQDDYLRMMIDTIREHLMSKGIIDPPKPKRRTRPPEEIMQTLKRIGIDTRTLEDLPPSDDDDTITDNNPDDNPDINLDDIKEDASLKINIPNNHAWDNANISELIAKKYINNSLFLNKMLDSSDTEAKLRSSIILDKFSNVLSSEKRALNNIRNIKDYKFLPTTLELVVLYVLVKLTNSYSLNELENIEVNNRFSSVIVKHTMDELRKARDELNYLKQIRSQTQSQPKPELNTRGVPSKDFKKLHDEHLEPEEPSTLPPQEMFRESIENMIDSIVGEQVSKWIK